jgi:hypothetical protein
MRSKTRLTDSIVDALAWMGGPVRLIDGGPVRQVVAIVLHTMTLVAIGLSSGSLIVAAAVLAGILPFEAWWLLPLAASLCTLIMLSMSAWVFDRREEARQTFSPSTDAGMRTEPMVHGCRDCAYTREMRTWQVWSEADRGWR